MNCKYYKVVRSDQPAPLRQLGHLVRLLSSRANRLQSPHGSITMLQGIEVDLDLDRSVFNKLTASKILTFSKGMAQSISFIDERER